MIYVNFKTYESGTGKRAVEMVEMMRQVERVSGVSMVPVVQTVDVYRVSKETGWDMVWCEHVDGIEYGKGTGWTLPEAVKQAGAMGTILNHAEHKFGSVEDLKMAVDRARAVGLSVGICANDMEEIVRVLSLRPDWIAYEPPELIGQSDISVASAKPEVVRDAVEACKGVETKLLIGAGIHDAEDIRVGLKLGADGFLLASAVMMSENPAGVLRELVSGYGA